MPKEYNYDEVILYEADDIPSILKRNNPDLLLLDNGLVAIWKNQRYSYVGTQDGSQVFKAWAE